MSLFIYALILGITITHILDTNCAFVGYNPQDQKDQRSLNFIDHRMRMNIAHAQALATCYKEQQHVCRKELEDREAHEKQQALIRAKEAQAIEQRHAIHEIYMHQVRAFQEYIQSWAQEHPERYQAYQETMTSQFQRSEQQYVCSSRASSMLISCNLSPSLYNRLMGNKLQHKLMREIISHLEKASTISSNLRNDFVYFHTFDTLEHARRVNEMGDVISAAKLIDLTKHMIDYCTVAIDGLISGVAQGATDAVMGMIQLVVHPVETVHNISLLSRKVAGLAHQYLPPLPPDAEDMNLEAWQNYERDCAQVAQKWLYVRDLLYEKWRLTPTRELIHQSSQMVGSFCTNIFVTAKCTQLLATAAAKSVQVLSKARQLQKAEHIFACKLIEGGESIKWCEQSSHYFCQEVAKESRLLSGAKEIVQREITAKDVIVFGQQSGLAEDQMIVALKNLENPWIEGDVKILCHAIKELKEITGIDKLLKKICNHSAIQDQWNRAKGSFYELQCGLEAYLDGHEIIEFGRYVGDVEYDIITKTHIIECKNTSWKHAIEDIKVLDKFIRQCKRGIEYAKENEKIYMVKSKKNIPEPIKAILKKLGVVIMEGK